MTYLLRVFSVSMYSLNARLIIKAISSSECSLQLDFPIEDADLAIGFFLAHDMASESAPMYIL